MAKNATSTGLDENVAALLSYLLGWVTGIIFYILEKENDYVRFHAAQSIVVFGSIFALSIILTLLQILPGIGYVAYLLGVILNIVAIVLWILLMVKAYQGEKYKVPVLGDFAEKL